VYKLRVNCGAVVEFRIDLLERKEYSDVPFKNIDIVWSLTFRWYA